MATFNHKQDCILFDLDGTLVDSSKTLFLLQNTYSLYIRFAKLFGPVRAISIVRDSINAMLDNNNNTTVTNYERLLQVCEIESGVSKALIEPELESFYTRDFLNWSGYFTAVPFAKEFVEKAKDSNKKLYVWTNPIWPEFNVKKRLEWGGFNSADFIGITHSKNSVGCKPNIEYFANSLKLFQLDPQNCLLIGDSAIKDSPAEQVGIKTVILGKDKAKSWQQLTQQILKGH